MSDQLAVDTGCRLYPGQHFGLGDRTQDLARQIQIVHTEVGGDATHRHGRTRSPSLPVVGIGAPPRDDKAACGTREVLCQRGWIECGQPVGQAQTMLEHDNREPLGGSRGRGEIVQFGNGLRRRLLDHDVLTAVQCAGDQFGSATGRQAERHDIYRIVAENFCEVANRDRNSSRHVGVRLDTRDNRILRTIPDGGEMALPSIAQSDHRDADAPGRRYSPVAQQSPSRLQSSTPAGLDRNDCVIRNRLLLSLPRRKGYGNHIDNASIVARQAGAGQPAILNPGRRRTRGCRRRARRGVPSR